MRDGCERDGYSYSSAEELAERIAACDTEAPPKAALAAALELGKPVVVNDGCHYPRHVWCHCEEALALHLAQRALQIAEPMSALDATALNAEIHAAKRGMGDHHRLHQGHRSDGGIRDLVQQCRRGEIDCHDRPGVRFSRSLPPPYDVGLSRVIRAYLAAIGRCGLERVALLMPRRKGDIHAPGWNTTFMNEALRREINPDGKRVPGTALRLGDRIIIRRNLALDDQGDEQVVNGDTRNLLGCTLDAAGTSVLHLELALDDGRTIRFSGGALESLALAYAMTVHAAQGSAYQEVIVICTSGSPAFVHRGMLYTAFSRARDSLTVLGDPGAIRAICMQPAPNRNALLVERTVSAMRRMHRAGIRYARTACRINRRVRIPMQCLPGDSIHAASS